MKKRFRTLPASISVLLIFFLIAGGFPAHAEDEPAKPPLASRLDDVAEMLTKGGADKPEEIFAPSFLSAVPKAQLNGISADYLKRCGAIVEIKEVAPEKWGGRYEFISEKKYKFPVVLSIEETPPHRITGLWFGNPEPIIETIEGLLSELNALPGKVSFLAASLGNGGPEKLHELNCDEPLAIGSAFKLYVLGALTDEIAAKKRKWDEVVALDAKYRSWPSGVTQAWPDGLPVTLATLATQMISISDNTATDHLLFNLGRERVEAQVAAMGHSKPELMRPFLATAEMFKIKCDPALLKEFSAASAKGKRKLLGGRIAEISIESLKAGSFPTKPTGIDKAEWFASASDLVRAMDWLRRETEKDGTARRILAVNPGLGLGDKWKYIGYKGGSEPGVLCMVFLLQSKEGKWFSLAAAWNNKKAALDETKFFGYMSRAGALLADEAAGEDAE